MPSKYFRSTDTTVELKDTMKLQKASLDLFAQELGYWWDVECSNYYIDHFSTLTRDKVAVSLETMQKWHNHEFVTEVESFP
jgi:hypothetical protein